MIYVRRRRPGPSSVSSGIVYIVAVVFSVALGAFFYGSYQKTKQAPRGYATGDLPGRVTVVSKSAATPAPTSTTEDADVESVPAATPTPKTAQESPPLIQPIVVATSGSSDAMPQIRAEPRVTWSVRPEDIPNPLKGKMDPVADTVVLASAQGQDRNGGGLTELPLRGGDAMVLARFDNRSVVGWTVTRASWHCKLLKGNLRTLSFSTVAVDWEEGIGTLEGVAADGATYAGANADKAPWTTGRAPLPALLRGNGNSLVCYSEPDNPDNRAGDWVVYELRPDIVQALVSGAASGLAICDEKGQLLAEPTIASREDPSFAHYIEVEGRAIDLTPPAQIEGLKVFAHPDLRRARTSGALLTWLAPGDDEMQGQAFRYDVRYATADVALDQATVVARELIPTPLPPARVEQMVVGGLEPDTEYTFYVRAADEAGQFGPVSKAKLVTAPSLEFADSPLPPSFDGAAVDVAPGQLSVEVLDPMTATDPLTGDGGGTVAKTSTIWDRASRSIYLRAARNAHATVLLQFNRKGEAFPQVRMEAQPFIAPDGKQLDLPTRLFRVAYAAGGSRTNVRWMGDALIPLAGPLDVAQAGFSVPGQKYQAVLAEIAVPKDAPAGLYRGKLKLGVASRPDVNLNVFLTVGDAVLGDPAFRVELADGPTAIAQVCKRDPLNAVDAREAERPYLQLAADHRANLVLVPYSSVGECPVPYSPRARGAGQEWNVATWQDWDARFQDFLSGPHVVLPLFDNWPMPFLDGYTCADQETVPAGRSNAVFTGIAKGIPGCISRDYWETFGTATIAFGQHFKETDRKNVEGHVWFTAEPTATYAGKQPPWNLAHPANRDDFLALQAFGEKGLARGAGAWGPSQLVFRVTVPDIRALCDYGEGTFNLLAVEDRRFSLWPLLKTRVGLTHERIWLQTEGLAVDAGGAGLATLALNAFLGGADGWSIYGVVGQADHWKKINDASVLYAGTALGETAPYPSLRLKAVCAIQEDLDLLKTLQERRRWTRDQLGDYVSRYLETENGALAATPDALRRLRYATLDWLAK